MGEHSVRLEDATYGRVVLVKESTATEAQARTAALASPGISGPVSTFVATQTINEADVQSVSGTDANGAVVYSTPNDALPDPTQPLPIIPPVVTDRRIN